MTATISGKTITQEWQRVLPGLAMQNNGLYKILGPLVIGITFDILRDKKRYSPYFVLTPLTDFPGVKVNAFTTLVQAQTPDKRQLFLPVEHAGNIDDITREAVVSQWQLPLHDATSQAALYSTIDRFGDYVTVKVKLAYRITLNVLKLQAALYVGDMAQVQERLAIIRQQMAEVAPAMLTGWFGDHTAWLQQLETFAVDRVAYLEKITALRKVPPFSKLPFNELYS